MEDAMSRVATPPKGPSMVTPTAPVKIPSEKIAMRAYEKWCQRGCPHGNDQQDWFEAERELLSETRGPTAGMRR
jgi:hypothetical protein